MSYGSISRDVQRLAYNFLDDVDDMRRASREADRRALSHFEPRVVSVAYRERSVAPPERHLHHKHGCYNGTVVSNEPLPTYHLRAHQRAPITRYVYVTEPAPNVRYSCDNLYSPDYVPLPTTHYRRAASPAPSVHLANAGYVSRYPSKHWRPLDGHRSTLHLPPTMDVPTSEAVRRERRKIERRLDNLLDYTPPPAEYYLDMKRSLRSISDKMNTHKTLLDRYAGIDIKATPTSVEDGVAAKYHELAERFGYK